jgi:hypothetical protein
VYGNEQSNLRIKRVLFEFPAQHVVRFFKRIFYTYLLRDFNAASLHLLVGILLLVSGAVFGVAKWVHYSALNTPAPSGTVLLATIQIILGVQFLLAWTTYDVNCNPSEAVSSKLRPLGSSTSSRQGAPVSNVDTLQEPESQPRLVNF